VLCVVTSFTLTGREPKIGPAKMANFSALTTEKAPQNAPNVKGCPKWQFSIDLGHPLNIVARANLGSARNADKVCYFFT
jgi:hypothetical protein